ncbi:hypothetical protein [Ancylobacter pratisalsi]|uniref:Uncharacterized protein n=1 Tax=Ancylobacter pratisalsi TaxID=1745854 RepID=A0A6P1YH76_9HYPH|nr:hypothetical protein [Ancylobacter pratisalsi]QIB32310.1 hypothetical protein G3A50_00270 [Ancylobacter pratisalsi]
MTTSALCMKAGLGRLTAVGIAAMAAFAAVPASALPLSGAGISQAAGNVSAPVEQVRCYGCAVGVGVAAGVVAGAAIANAARPRGYYVAPRYYGPPPGRVYYGRPVYAPPANRCWVETNPMRGTGYWTRC